MARPGVKSFSRVPDVTKPRSSFRMPFDLKTTFDSGWLVPVFRQEIYPGDTFNVKMRAFARLATPLHPFMDNVRLSSFFFFVPWRLTWDKFQRFMGEQIDPGDSIDFTIPQMVSPVGGYANGTLYDYLGLPTLVAGISHSALYPRACALIWNEWFRDENLQDSIVVSRGDGPDLPSAYTLMRRGKRHDYFTAMLPFPQKGPAVDLPLGTSAPVVTNGATDDQLGVWSTLGSAYKQIKTDGAVAFISGTNLVGSGGMYTDLSDAAGATINALREAFAMQDLFEIDARGGTRYTEIVRAHFGVVSPDMRLQRPEFLGGGVTDVNVTPIAQTSETSAESPQANLAAMGTSYLKNHGFTKSFTEHGCVIGFVCADADLTYQQGLERDWSRETKYDFYWPAFAHLGEQAVLNKEIMAQGTSVDNDVLGYQERWAELRYKPSRITGKFRSNDPQSLDTWHLGQDFATLPVLNSDFIVSNPPMERVIAVESEPDFLMDAHFDVVAARTLPMYGLPARLGRF